MRSGAGASIVWTLVGLTVLAVITFTVVGTVKDHNDVAQAQKVYDAQVAGCERGNILRQEINDRAVVLRRLVKAMHKDKWLDAVADIPLVDCPTAFPRPS